MTVSPLLPVGRDAVESYRRDGYYIHRGLFDRSTAEAAAAVEGLGSRGST